MTLAELVAVTDTTPSLVMLVVAILAIGVGFVIYVLGHLR